MRSILCIQIASLIFLYTVDQSSSASCQDNWSTDVCKPISTYCSSREIIQINCQESCGLCDDNMDMDTDKEDCYTLLSNIIKIIENIMN